MISPWFEEARLGGSAVPTGPELQRTHGHMEGPGMKRAPTVAERVVAEYAHGPCRPRDTLVEKSAALVWPPRILYVI
jgi:hypothetical protein